MSRNLLTEDLILEALSDKGVAEPGTLDTEDAMKIVLEHFDATFKNEWSGWCDVYYYTETTADGYEIWVATQDEKNVCISEDVYYYDNEWLDGLADNIEKVILFTLTTHTTVIVVLPKLLKSYMKTISMI